MFVVMLIIIFAISGCSTESSNFIHKGIDEEWSIEIPEKFQKENEEQIEGYYITTYADEKGNKFTISEVEDKDSVIDENFFENEIGEDSYFHAERKEVLDIENFGKVFGVIGEDHSTNSYFIYYKAKIKDKALSFVSFKDSPFTEREESEIKAIISNLKGYN